MGGARAVPVAPVPPPAPPVATADALKLCSVAEMVAMHAGMTWELATSAISASLVPGLIRHHSETSGDVTTAGGWFTLRWVVPI